MNQRYQNTATGGTKSPILSGRLQSWDWIDKKYKYQNYKWSATDDVISFDMEELPDWGAGGSSIRYYTVTPTSLTLYYSDGDLDGVYTKE